MTTPAWTRRFPTVTLDSGSADADLANDTAFTADVRSYTLPTIELVMREHPVHGGRGVLEAPVAVRTSDFQLVLTGVYAALLATIGTELDFALVEEAINIPDNTVQNLTYEIIGLVKTVDPGQVTQGGTDIPAYTLGLSTRVYKLNKGGVTAALWDIDHKAGTYQRDGADIFATTSA